MLHIKGPAAVPSQNDLLLPNRLTVCLPPSRFHHLGQLLLPTKSKLNEMPPPPRSPPGQPSLRKHHQPWHRSCLKPRLFLPFERPAMELSLELFWSPPQGRPILKRSNGVCRMSEALKNPGSFIRQPRGGVPSSPTPIPSLGPGHSRVTGSVLRPQGRPRGEGHGAPGSDERGHNQDTACTCRRLHGGCALAAPCLHLVRVRAAPAASVHSEIANVQTEAPAARARSLNAGRRVRWRAGRLRT